MNAEIKQRWIDALKSGEYVATHQRMIKTFTAHNPPLFRDYGAPNRDCIGFSAVGVLFDLYMKSTGREWIWSDDLNQYIPLIKEKGKNTIAFDVLSWAGLSPVKGLGYLAELKMIDHINVSFNEIAKMIESSQEL